MATTEQILAQMAKLMQEQNERMDEERQQSAKREENMRILFENVVDKLPNPAPVPPVPEANPKIPSSATPAPMLLHNASLREFVTWKQKFSDYCLLTGVDKVTNNEKKAVLRSLLDDEWFRVAKFALNIKMMR